MYFIRPQDILVKNGIYIGTYPIKIVLISGILGFSILVVAFKVVKGKINKNNMYCHIDIKLFEKTKKVKAVIDTGNFLKEPITGAPVVVIEREELLGLVDENIINNIDKIINGELSEEIDISKYSSRIRLIPFTSLGKKNGLLLGISVDSIEIDFEDTTRRIENAIIGIYNDVLSSTKKYNALIGVELIEKSETIGAII